MTKELEDLKDLRDYFDNKRPLSFNGAMRRFYNIEKSLKALEIIKEKKVHTRFIRMANDEFTYLDYNKQFAREPSEDLTQEEFDLVKEELKNEHY